MVAGAAGSVLATASAKSGRAADGERRPYRIVMLTWRGWDAACQGFKDYFDERRIPVELIIRDADQNARRIPEYVAETKALAPDLVYTWGTTTAITALGTVNNLDPARHITDIPAVFNIVTEPVANGVIRDLAAPGRPVTGTLYVAPLDIQLRTIAVYRPFKRMGTVYNPLERNAVIVIEMLRQAAQDTGFELVEQPVGLGDDGQPLIESIPRCVAEIAAVKADWLYIPPDTFLNVNRGVLAQAALDMAVPSFTATERFVTEGRLLMGLVSRYYNIGQFTGYKAEQILVRGVDPSRIPVEPLSRFSLIINMLTANLLRIYPPISMLRYAETV